MTRSKNIYCLMSGNGLPMLFGNFYEARAYCIDLKNLPDFDPDQDPERHLFREQVLEDWSRADREECSKGAMPRFYKQFDVLKKEPNEITFSSDDYTTTPLSSECVPACFHIHSRTHPPCSIFSPSPLSLGLPDPVPSPYHHLVSHAYLHPTLSEDR